MNDFKKGVIYAASSYILWGILPLYWRLLNFTSPFHILGCRIVFSLIFTAIILFITGKRNWLRLFSGIKSFLWILCSGWIISLNWGIYIWAVNMGHMIDASLGYYINPLVVVLLGLAFMKERLSRLQWIAFGLACAGVLLLTFFSGIFPWIAVLLALSFGFYGFFKKKSSAGALESLAAETLAAFPLGLTLILFPLQDLPVLISFSLPRLVLLAFAGAVTAIPLLAFARGAKLLPLSTAGFLQFVQPTILFFMGVFVFGENFPPRNLWAFGCIWAAVILYCLSLRLKKSRP